MGTFLTKERKHVKLMCGKCNSKIYLDNKKEILKNLYCSKCYSSEEYEGYKCIGEIRYVRIEYK